MLNVENCRIYIRPGKTDMRKAINGLSAMVSNSMNLNPLAGDLFLFSNRRNSMKVLYWDRNGYCLWQKRLEKHRFPWPKSDDEVLELTKQEWEWLLAGINFFDAHETLVFSQP